MTPIGGAKAGTAYVDVQPDLSSLSKQVGAFFAGSKWNALGKKAGIGLGIGLGAGAAIATGKALFDVGKQFDDAYDQIRIQTGATGKDLEKLKDNFREVVRAVPTDFDTAAKAVGGLHQRLELTGGPLNRLSKQVVELTRLTGTDVGENVESITRLFGDWSIKTKDQSKTLDQLFRVSQETGIGLSDLSRMMVSFGSPMRQLGLDFDFGAAMFARFEKEGVNITTLMPGLRYALKSFSGGTAETTAVLKDWGINLKDPEQALQDVFKLLEDAPSDLKANEIAFKVFGQRAGPDMAAAVREGRFELDELMETVRGGDDTIRKSGRETMDLSEHWTKFKNNLKLKVEPVAIKVFEGLGDAMKDVTKIMSDPKLTSGEKLQKMLDLASSALSDLVSKAGHAAPKIAGALVKGILNADIWGKLLVGGWLLTKLGGLAAFRDVGKKGGKTFGRSFALGMLIALPLLLPEAFELGQKIGRKIRAGAESVAEGLAGLFKDEAAPGSAKEIRKPFMAEGSNISFEAAVKGLQDLGKSSEEATKTVERWLQRMGRSSEKTLRDMARDSGNLGERIAASLDSKTEKGTDAVGRNFKNVERAVQGSMRNAKKATDRGGDAIQSSLAQQLRKYGIKDPESFLSKTAAGGGRKESGARRGSTTGYKAGGFAGILPGYSQEDDRLIGVRGGEAVLRPEDHIPMVDKSLRLTHGIGLREMFKRTGAKIAGYASGGMVSVPGWPGESANSAVVGALSSYLKRFKLWLSDAYGPGHASLEHTRYGTAADVGPVSGNWAEMGLALRYAMQQGWTPIGYDGSYGTESWSGHGPPASAGDNAHAHVTLLTVAELLAGKKLKGGVAKALSKIKLPRFAAQAAIAAGGATGLNKVAAYAEQAAQRKLQTMGGREGSEMGAGMAGLSTKGPIADIARAMVTKRWSAGQWPPFLKLKVGESGPAWDPTITNPSSGAGGIPQALPPSKMGAPAWPPTQGRESIIAQLNWMLGYIGDIYGDPAGAYGTWLSRSPHWYEQGGIVDLWGKGLAHFAGGGAVGPGGPGGRGSSEDGKGKDGAKGGSKRSRIEKLWAKLGKADQTIAKLDEKIDIEDRLASLSTSEADSDMSLAEKNRLITLNSRLYDALLGKRGTLKSLIGLVGKRLDGPASADAVAKIRNRYGGQIDDLLDRRKGVKPKQREKIDKEIDKLKRQRDREIEAASKKVESRQGRRSSLAEKLADARGQLVDVQGVTGGAGRLFDTQLTLAELKASALGTGKDPMMIEGLLAFAEAARYGAFDSQLPAFHGGGIVDVGQGGSREVIARLQHGEGVVDADTMDAGLGGGGPYEMVVVNWDEGRVLIRRVADGRIAEHDRAGRAVAMADVLPG